MIATADTLRITGGRDAGIAFLRRPGSANSQTVVMLHGIGSNGGSFVPLIDALPATLDAIAWHAPGYGGSRPVAPASPHPADYGDALLELLNALHLADIILVGHSLGCLFAASFAARHPGRVRALALLSPALGYGVKPGEALPDKVQSRIDELRALGPLDFAAKRAARLVYQPQQKPAVATAVRDAMAAVNPDGYAQAVRALGAGDLLADAAKLPMRTLVAVGAEDVITPPDNARQLYGALPRPAGFHEIPGTGHALPQEDPAGIARLLTELIEDSDA